MSEIVEQVARALLAALEQQGPDAPFVAGEPGNVTLDGVFDLNKVASAVIAFLSSPEWQPIETAPKDGTKIIAIENFEREDDEGRKYPKDCEVVKWSDAAGAWVAFGIGLSSFEPTHWRPLDPPPQS